MNADELVKRASDALEGGDLVRARDLVEFAVTEGAAIIGGRAAR